MAVVFGLPVHISNLSRITCWFQISHTSVMSKQNIITGFPHEISHVTGDKYVLPWKYSKLFTLLSTGVMSIHLTGKTPQLHNPLSRQRNIGIICLKHREPMKRPPPCDDTLQVCRLCNSGSTCESPVQVCTHEISFTPPTSTHMHTGHQHHTGQGKGSSWGWGARRLLHALIFTSPTRTLCDQWHTWSPAACLSCSCLSPLFTVLFTTICFVVCGEREGTSFRLWMWTNMTKGECWKAWKDTKKGSFAHLFLFALC